MNSFVEQIKVQYHNGSMTIRLIMVNVGVFFVIQVLDAIQRLEQIPVRWTSYLFALPGTLENLAYQPWTFVSALFAHFGFWHLLSNLVFLYFAGSTYEKFYGSKKMLHLYLLGGIAGNLTEILAHLFFPALQGSVFSVVGASGAIMAIFMALAIGQPQLQVQLFGVIPLRIYMLAIFFFLKDLSAVGTTDSIAHFAHIGGALFGIWSIQPRMKVKKGGRPLTDDQYRAKKQEKQARLDEILDKISKKGYDALSKEEKEFLFQQSKDV